MSPNPSSLPMMSVKVIALPVFSSVTRPMEIPATGDFNGTPASISAKVAPHTVAIELEPFDSRISEVTRMVYGKSASAGIIGSIERSANAPCPISRRPGPPVRLVSPTLNGGKL